MTCNNPGCLHTAADGCPASPAQETRCTACALTNLPCMMGHTGRVLERPAPTQTAPDLVAALREAADSYESQPGHGSYGIDLRCAADEIERLRAQVEQYKRVPIRLEFDFRNPFQAFGAAQLPESESDLPVIRVNMAAILHCCTENPELRWKDFTAETTLHELLHVIQWAIGEALVEGDIDESIARVREDGDTDLPPAEQDQDVLAVVTAQRDEAILALRKADAKLAEAAEALETTAGNIRSLGPAGAIPEPYTVWLALVEQTAAAARREVAHSNPQETR